MFRKLFPRTVADYVASFEAMQVKLEGLSVAKSDEADALFVAANETEEQLQKRLAKLDEMVNQLKQTARNVARARQSEQYAKATQAKADSIRAGRVANRINDLIA